MLLTQRGICYNLELTPYSVIINYPNDEKVQYNFSSQYYVNMFNDKLVESEEILRYYKRKTDKLCLKVKAKCVKRPFMYNKVLRGLILKTGVGAIQLKMQERKA